MVSRLEEVAEGKNYSFPKEEERILQFWDDEGAFQEQLKRSEGKKPYVFFDGPPFATGLPHYGHLLAGTIKDIVTRYATATGHYCPRRFGWDCHGLPVEYEIDKKLDIKGRQDVLDMGIDKYNEECRAIVMRYSQEWEKTVRRIGRWIDFKNDYKTMHPSFMESVWWVFQQLHEKGLVYKGFKVMPYSTGCCTPLSNFEAGLNYKDVSDPAVMVSFPLDGDADGAHMVAWTTTPWTLPSNLALCVNPDFTYVKVKDPEKGKVYIVAEPLLAKLPGAVPQEKKGKKAKEGDKAKGGFEVLAKMQGKDLAGRTYEPMFPYFADHKASGAFRIVTDGYVTADSGTGVVHCAPAFGEDDNRVCLANGIIAKGAAMPCPVDGDGRFTAEVTDFAGKYVKDADKEIMKMIKDLGRLVDHQSYVHSYPYCWRSDTPLIYKAVPSWFVRVELIKERLLVNNGLTTWVPSYVKEKRFHNWLENAHDWAVSRSRFWGTPLPIWMSDDGEEIVVVGSIQQLYELSGHKVEDLHRHFIDHITIPSRQGKGVLRRVDEVFDCWFESGSMPYASVHYPFENKETFLARFPADFVAEGLDQTRGWFYTLMVLSTALFDKPAFKNLVCNGLVLAEDGKKMSKRLQNYPDPVQVLNEYGADALRLYLINSPVVRAETLKFKKEGVFAVVKDVFLPWYNAYRFLVQNVLRQEADTHQAIDFEKVDVSKATNVLDRWINAASRSLTAFVRQEMGAYRLYTVVPHLVKFIDNLTNIYVRYNRKRLKGRNGPEDCQMALASLYDVLLTVCKVMAPFTPFFTEVLYQNLRRGMPNANLPKSVHFCDMPEAATAEAGDEAIQQSVDRMQRVIELTRLIRDHRLKPLKTPLQELVVVHTDEHFLRDISGELREYVLEEVNVHQLVTCSDPLKYATLRAEPVWEALGKRCGRSMGKVSAAIKAMSAAQIQAFEKTQLVTFEGFELGPCDIKVLRDFKIPEGVSAEDMDANGDGEVLVVLDLRVDESQADAGVARELVNRVQKLRKKAGLVVTDMVDVYLDLPDTSAAGVSSGVQANGAGPSSSTLQRVVDTQAGYIAESLGVRPQQVADKPAHAVVLAREQQAISLDDEQLKFEILLTRPALALSQDAIRAAAGGSSERAQGVSAWLVSRDLSALLRDSHAGGGRVAASIDGQTVQLEAGKQFHFPSSMTAARQ
ncbi:hypothetical protein WJX72_001779 [[Myrmecia] bisecta]|uniref:isoleucine--tRNA ligase n=1 Tax=[Myrmecia] bisecta TaxID=41462 RepID=A0AAW1PAB4_9CHLO